MSFPSSKFSSAVGLRGPQIPWKCEKALLSESFYSLCWGWGPRLRDLRIWAGRANLLPCVGIPGGVFLSGGHPASSWALPVTGTHFFMMLPHCWELRTALLILPRNLPPFHFYPLIFLPMKTHSVLLRTKTQTPCHLPLLPCKLLYLQWVL